MSNKTNKARRTFVMSLPNLVFKEEEDGVVSDEVFGRILEGIEGFSYAVVVRRNGRHELMFAHDDLLRQGGPIKLYPFPDLPVYELVEPDIISSIYKI